MGQAKNKKRLDEMSFTDRLQHDASQVVTDSTFLVENQVAEWKSIVMPDGAEVIALIFPARLWEVREGKLDLKGGK